MAGWRGTLPPSETKGETMHTYCERCETEELQNDPKAIADICDSCDDKGGPIETMRDMIEAGALDR